MTAEPFNVTVADAGENILVTCTGELDLISADSFRSSLDWVLALHPQTIHVDCCGITFLDSSGIKSLVHLASTCRGKGIVLTLSVNERLQRLFERIGIAGLFSSAP